MSVLDEIGGYAARRGVLLAAESGLEPGPVLAGVLGLLEIPPLF